MEVVFIQRFLGALKPRPMGVEVARLALALLVGRRWTKYPSGKREAQRGQVTGGSNQALYLSRIHRQSPAGYPLMRLNLLSPVSLACK